MQVSDSFTASLTGPKSTEIHAVQGDGARMVTARLYAGPDPWVVPQNVVGGIAYTLPDGTSGYYEELKDGSVACTIAGNQISAVIAPRLCRESGTVEAVIVLRQGNRQISTFPFRLLVTARPGLPELTPDGPDATPAFAGKLFYGDAGGNPIPLGIGSGLAVEDGQLLSPFQTRPEFDSVTLVSGTGEVHLFANGDKLTVTGLDGAPVVLRNLAEPVEERDAVSKFYVDSVAAELLAEIRYVPIFISDFGSNAAIVELGTVLDSVTLSWGLNKAPVSQTMNGSAIAVTDRSFKVQGPVSDSMKFTLSVTDERDAQDSTATTVLFCSGIYYGALEDGTEIDSGVILGLTRKLQGNRFTTFTVRAEGKRPVFALPTRYGTPSFAIGGFAYEWTRAASIEFTNGSGYTEPYDVWQHGQNVDGSIAVTVS